jgi:hypothetical protein
MSKKKTQIRPVRDFHDLWEKAEKDENYQRLCIGALENLGCEHLAAKGVRSEPKWKRYYNGLMDYVSSLVGEYGESEGAAFEQVVDEINFVIGCCDDVSLEDETPKGKKGGSRG